MCAQRQKIVEKAAVKQQVQGRALHDDDDVGRVRDGREGSERAGSPHIPREGALARSVTLAAHGRQDRWQRRERERETEHPVSRAFRLPVAVAAAALGRTYARSWDAKLRTGSTPFSGTSVRTVEVLRIKADA